MIDQLLDALSYAGDALGKPGRAVRGVLAGNPDELAAAIPFSDSLGLSDPSHATSGKDLLNALGMDVGSGLGGDVAGFATEVATDPLTWLGAGLGSRLGGAAERAAVARGPQYTTKASDLNAMLDAYSSSQAASRADPVAAMIGEVQSGAPGRRIKEILSSPASNDLLSRIPEGGQILGAGAEGIAFGNPNGMVNRIGRVMPGEPGRPQSDAVLQSLHASDIPVVGRHWRSELLPKVDQVGAGWLDNPFSARPVDKLETSLANSGLSFADKSPGNYGMLGGRPVVIDPGAVEPIGQYTGGFQPTVTAGDPSMPMNALLKLLGARDAVRAGSPSFSPMMTLLGGAAGADAGAAGRMFGGR